MKNKAFEHQTELCPRKSCANASNMLRSRLTQFFCLHLIVITCLIAATVAEENSATMRVIDVIDAIPNTEEIKSVLASTTPQTSEYTSYVPPMQLATEHGVYKRDVAPTVLPPHPAARSPQSDSDDRNREVIDYSRDVLGQLEFVETLARPNGRAEVENFLGKHHNEEEMKNELLRLSSTCSDIMRLYSIGTSTENRTLWAVEFAEPDNLGMHKLMKPEFRYVANVHGNEVVGREMLIRLARLLCENHRAAQREKPPSNTTPLTFAQTTTTDQNFRPSEASNGQDSAHVPPNGPSFVKKLLASTRIHLLPSLNPDGYARSVPSCHYEMPSMRGRVNAHNIDLDTNFPSVGNRHRVAAPNSATQKEVKAFIEWSRQEPFVMSANLRGGALVVSYPYDTCVSESNSSLTDCPTPDDNLFRALSTGYSMYHTKMSTGNVCYDACGSASDQIKFSSGITNGAAWHGSSVRGSMIDWLYDNTNEFSVAIELGCNQYPESGEQLARYWAHNKVPLLAYLTQVQRGIKGFVLNERTSELLADVRVSVTNQAGEPQREVKSTKYGDYFRLLAPGRYVVEFDKSPEYEPQKIELDVADSMAQLLPIKLVPRANGDEVPKNTPETNNNPTSNGIETTTQVSKNHDENSDHALIVSILVMITIMLFMSLALFASYVMTRQRRKRSKSLSMELQGRGATTGVAATSSAGSSTNQHRAAAL